jgi:hypothetical protein
MALLNWCAATNTHDQHRQLVEETHTIEEPSEDVSRVYGDPGDFRVVARELVGVQELSEFGLAVAGPFAEEAEVCLGGFEGCKINSLGGSLLVSDGSHVNDADVCSGLFGGGLQEWKEELDEEGVAELVCGELDLVAVHAC